MNWDDYSILFHIIPNIWKHKKVMFQSPNNQHLIPIPPAPEQTSRFDLHRFGKQLRGDEATRVAAAQHLDNSLVKGKKKGTTYHLVI